MQIIGFLVCVASVRYPADDPSWRGFLGEPSIKFPKPYAHLWRTYIFGTLSHSNSSSCFLTLGTAPHPRGPCANREENVMSLHSIHSEKLATLARRVCLADEATPELFSEIVAKTARRL